MHSAAADQWSVRYEDLREQALNSCSGGQCSTCGLTLFLRRGLVAWMRAWPQQTPSPKPVHEADSFEQSQERMRFSAELRDQVVSVLTNMVLHNRKEILA